ncbi:MAG TPA: hypothetical protein V6C81_08840 [Planktothrix sp.]
MFDQSHFADFIALGAMSQVLQQVAHEDERDARQRLVCKEEKDTEESGGNANNVQNRIDWVSMPLAVVNDK